MKFNELMIVGQCLGINIYELKIERKKQVPRFLKNRYLIHNDKGAWQQTSTGKALMSLTARNILDFDLESNLIRFFVTKEGKEAFEKALKEYLLKLNLFPVEAENE